MQNSPDSPQRKLGNTSYISSQQKIKSLIKGTGTGKIKLNKTIVLKDNNADNVDEKDDKPKAVEDPIKSRY